MPNSPLLALCGLKSFISVGLALLPLWWRVGSSEGLRPSLIVFICYTLILVFALIGPRIVPMLIPAEMEVGLVDSLTRVSRYAPAPGSKSLRLYAAGNEWESFQVVVHALYGELKNVKVQVSTLVSESGAIISNRNIKLYREFSVRIRRPTPGAPIDWREIPDILVPFKNPYTGEDLTSCPYDACPFDVAPGENQIVWVDIHVPANAEPGLYCGHVVVRSERKVEALRLELVVWAFTLPSRPDFRTFFLVDEWVLRDTYGLDVQSAEFMRLIRKYYLMLVEHHVNPGYFFDGIPEIGPNGEAIFDTLIPGLGTVAENIEYYMGELGLDLFMVPLWTDWPPAALRENRTLARRYIRDIYEFFRGHGWENRLVVYVVDEPETLNNFSLARRWGMLVDEISPEIAYLITLLDPYVKGTDWSSVKELEGYVDLWVILPGPFYNKGQLWRLSQRLAAGEEVWSYTALTLNRPGPVWQIDYYPIEYRIFPWLDYVYGYTGMLYWCVNFWTRRPWRSVAYRFWGQHYNGEGILLYPGTTEKVGFDGPIASMRLKWIRDGIEDYQYLKTAEKLGISQETIKEMISETAQSWEEWTKNPETLLETRKELAETIENTISD